MEVAEFYKEVKEYLHRTGRKQGWLRDRLLEKGFTLAQSSFSERMTGRVSFLESEVNALNKIMKKYKQ